MKLRNPVPEVVSKPIRKRYVYKCRCGKRPMRGSISLKPGTDFQFQQIFDIPPMQEYRPGVRA